MKKSAWGMWHMNIKSELKKKKILHNAVFVSRWCNLPGRLGVKYWLTNSALRNSASSHTKSWKTNCLSVWFPECTSQSYRSWPWLDKKLLKSTTFSCLMLTVPLNKVRDHRKGYARLKLTTACHLDARFDITDPRVFQFSRVNHLFN